MCGSEKGSEDVVYVGTHCRKKGGRSVASSKEDRGGSHLGVECCA